MVGASVVVEVVVLVVVGSSVVVEVVVLVVVGSSVVVEVVVLVVVPESVVVDVVVLVVVPEAVVVDVVVLVVVGAAVARCANEAKFSILTGHHAVHSSPPGAHAPTPLASVCAVSKPRRLAAQLPHPGFSAFAPLGRLSQHPVFLSLLPTH